MVGSLSPITRRQVEAGTSYTHLEITTGMLAGDRRALAILQAAAIGILRDGKPVMVRTVDPGAAMDGSAETKGVSHITADFVTAIMRVAPLGRVCIASGDTSHHATQAQAIQAAREIAQNQGTELLIHGRNGQIRERDSHGHDSCPPRG